jgi:hypothetical protein
MISGWDLCDRSISRYERMPTLQRQLVGICKYNTVQCTGKLTGSSFYIEIIIETLFHLTDSFLGIQLMG